MLVLVKGEQEEDETYHLSSRLRRLPGADARIVMATLGRSDAARIIRLWGRTSVLVGDRAPRTLMRAIAEHVLRYHDAACTAASCPGLWPWMRAAAASEAGAIA
jgi:hypothetical protein